MTRSTPASQGAWLWLLQRVTAALLMVGIGVHFWVGHYTGVVTSDRVHERLQHPAWLIFDLFLVSLLAFHGINGLRNIVRDYNPRRPRLVDCATLVLIVAMILYCARDLSRFHGMG